MDNIAQLSLAVSFVIVGICIHLVARVWSPGRLFFVHLGRDLTEADRARSRRVIWFNLGVCLLGVAGSFAANTSLAFLLLASVLPLVPLAWLMVELVGLLRSLPHSRVPGRFMVPLAEQPSVTSYVSAPLQVTNVVLLLVTSTIFIWLLQRLPARVPAHWNLAGQVDRWGSPAELWLMGGWLLSDLALMWFVAWIVSRERWALPPDDAERYQTLQRQRRALIVRLVEWMILGLNVSIAAMWLLLAAANLPGKDYLRGWGLAGSLSLMAVAVVAPMVVYLGRLVRVQDQLRKIAGSDVLGTHDHGWKAGGIIYYAPADPALFVPKKIGIGTTLNFGRPGAWLIIGALTVLPLVLTLAAVIFTR